MNAYWVTIENVYTPWKGGPYSGKRIFHVMARNPGNARAKALARNKRMDADYRGQVSVFVRKTKLVAEQLTIPVW